MRRTTATRLQALPKPKAEFILPMECALISKLPNGPGWIFEVKLDGYRAIGVKTTGEAILYSRNGKNFNKRYPLIAKALGELPADTVIDGEVVALDDAGRPDFHALQHFQASASRIHYFVFDLLIWNGRDLTKLPLSERREHLASLKLRSPIRISEQFDISLDNMISVVREQGLEGVVAKRKSSFYEAGKRTGSLAACPKCGHAVPVSLTSTRLTRSVVRIVMRCLSMANLFLTVRSHPQTKRARLCGGAETRGCL